MAKYFISATLVSAWLCWAVGQAKAEIMIQDIKSPKDCAPYLTVTSTRAKEGLTSFTVRIQPEEATNAGALYRGRVQTVVSLRVLSGNSTLAVVPVQQSPAGNTVEVQFDLANSLATASVLTIHASLYEKDGVSTLGGGRVFKIHLGGFLPAEAP
jgi:hypothetical protein